MREGRAATALAIEIRGLGAESFFKKKATRDVEATRQVASWVLDVALLWGETVLAARTYRRGEAVRPCADLAVPRELLGLGVDDEFALVPAGERFVLDLSNPNITGDVLIGDGVRSIADIDERSLVIGGPMRARLKVGELTLLMAHAPIVDGAKVARAIDKEPSMFIGLSAIVQVAFLMVASTTPEDVLMHSRDPRAERDKVVQALRITVPDDEVVAPREQVIEVREERRTDKALVVDRVAIPVVEPAPERGTPLVDKMRRKPSQETTLATAPRREDAKERAQQTALATAFRANDPIMQALMTNPDLDAKPSPFKALGGNDPGGGAYDDSGSVSPFGAFQPAGMAFIPSDGGPDDAPGGPIAGKDKIAITREPEFTPPAECCTVIPMRPVVSGELDAAIVQQTIRRYLSGIKWCYQERVQGNRTLGGKATMSFSILPNGTISDARLTNDTIRDAPLQACILTKMARWRFPQPKDGGVVEVDYPLILKTP